MTQPPETPPVAPEFSRFVNADRVAADEVVEQIEARPAERRALAERFELEAIESLTATVRLRRVRGGQMIEVRGHLEADVVQTCVVTLDPVPNHVSDDFSALFAPPHLVPEEELEIDLTFAADAVLEDVPEAMVNNRIDIGELTAQHLSLALDPFPRAPGVDYVELRESSDDEEAETPPNPFAALARLRRPH